VPFLNVSQLRPDALFDAMICAPVVCQAKAAGM
jgi:hypothetical protein